VSTGSKFQVSNIFVYAGLITLSSQQPDVHVVDKEEEKVYHSSIVVPFSSFRREENARHACFWSIKRECRQMTSVLIQTMHGAGIQVGS
jgi:hypothetical protein